MNREDLEECGEDGVPEQKIELFSSFIRMWPRAIFHRSSEAESSIPQPKSVSVAREIEALKRPGVYILYRDDKPFYVGQTSGDLCSRLETHALHFSRRSYFWNYFSAFLVDNQEHRMQLESLLIATMPLVLSNSAVPRLIKEPMPDCVRDMFKAARWEGRY